MHGISIVTPSLNQAQYLEQCIDSILSQNYPGLEYIIMDGGSTDGSVEIIKKYEKHLSYWQSRPDGGQYRAINEGFRRSTGSVMGWLNADDMLHRGGLAVLDEVFSKLPHVEFLTGRRVGFEGDGRLHPFEHQAQTWCHDQLLNEDLIHKYSLMVMQEGTYWRRSLWEKAGATLDTGFQLAADFELWLRLSRHAHLYSVDALTGGFRMYSMEQRCNKHRKEYLEECSQVIARELELGLPPAPHRCTAPPLIRYPLVRLTPPAVITPRALPRLTIVTPSYNQAQYLEECLDSVFSQGYPNLEYIVMDGGSTDGSLEIIRKYEKHLSHWQSGADGGQYRAINEGFRHATGEIMAWINSDDKYHPGALTLVGDAFLGCPEVEWLTGSPTLWDAEGRAAGFSMEPPAWSRGRYLAGEVNAPFIQQESTFWRRTLWERAGGGLDPQFALAGDLELWARFFRFAPLHTLHAPLGGFRTRPGEGQRSETHLEQYNREAERVVMRERLLFQAEQEPRLDPPPPTLTVSDVVRRAQSRITAENFGFFTYSRTIHFPFFAPHLEGLPGRTAEPGGCDLKGYQELLICSFIRQNIPVGARVLGFGRRTSGIVRALEADYEVWNLDPLQGESSDLLQRQVYGVRLVDDEIGGFSELLREGYFDFAYGIGDYGERQESEAGCLSICRDIERVLKPGSRSLHCFEVVARGERFQAPRLMHYLFEQVCTQNSQVPFQQIPLDPFTFATTLQQPQRHGAGQAGGPVIERHLSYNVLWAPGQDRNDRAHGENRAPCAAGSAGADPHGAPTAQTPPPRDAAGHAFAVSTPPQSPAAQRRLHIGGETPAPGWEIMNILPGPHVDHSGNANDLSRFPDASFQDVYASHILEHFDYQAELLATLKEWHRVLRPFGTVYLSVPDLDILARLLLDKGRLNVDDRFAVMRMMFGGHVGGQDYHGVGLNEDFLTYFLHEAGFALIRRVDQFRLFDDTSSMTFKGELISLNMLARKLPIQGGPAN